MTKSANEQPAPVAQGDAGLPVTVVVCAVIERDGKLLAALRASHERYGGLWELPGGKVRPGETRAQALEREIREELALAVRAGPEVGASTLRAGERVIELHALRCQVLTGEPVAREHAQLTWVTPEQALGLPWAPADQPLIADLVARWRAGG